MISDSSSFVPPTGRRHSLRESGNISVQDHMRAMAIADSDTQVFQQPPSPAEEKNALGIHTGSKRSSVIEMWRKREMSLSSNQLSKPMSLRKISSDRGFRHTEEKKEPTLEEDVVDSESHEMVSKKRISEPASTTRRIVFPPTPLSASPPSRKLVSPSTPAWNQPSTRNTRKEQESPLEDSISIKRLHGTSSAPCDEDNPSTSNLPASSTRWSGASGNVGHGRREQREQEPDEPAKISPASSPKRVSITRATPVTPDDSDSPAFSDLKSKWAKFGAQKGQARVVPKAPTNAVYPMVHKVTSKNSQQPTKPVGKGCDESSIDGDTTTDTQGQSNNTVGSAGATILKQPVSKEDNADKVPEEVEKSSKRKSARHETSSPKDDDSPAKKVATYMYMKGRPNTASGPTRESDKSETQDNSTFAPRLNALPKRMLQRKILLDKQRRRSKGTSPNRSTIPSITNDEDALNEAFNKTCAENDKFDLPVKRAVADPIRADNALPMIKSRIPIQSLMAFGAEEDEFLAAESGLRKTMTIAPLTQQVQEEEYGYGGSKISDDMDEFESQPPSLPSKSVIATRAQKTLREKRSRPRAIGASPERTSVPLKEPNYGATNHPRMYSEDEMMTLDEEHGGTVPPRANRVIDRSERPSDEFKVSCGSRFWGGFNEPEPSGTFDESVSASTTSHMLSLTTSASDVTSARDSQFGPARSRDSLLDGDDIVADRFVSESNTNVDAFAASFQSLSFSQLANDIKEEAGSVLKGVNFQKLSSNWNEGVAAASQSLGEATSRLNKFVGKDVFAKVAKAIPHPTVPDRIPSPVEEIAIEVEYVEDSDDGEG